MEASTTKENGGNRSVVSSGRASRRVSVEIIGEIVLLLVVGSFFAYLFFQSLHWPLGSALMPWIAITVGIPFWLWRMAVLVFRAKESTGQIMDIGFRSGGDPLGERARFMRICCYIVGLYLAIWLVGFHIALPAGILFYVRVYGKMSWIGSILLALCFVVLIIGVYDHLINAAWHEPPLLKWIYSFLPQPQ